MGFICTSLVTTRLLSVIRQHDNAGGKNKVCNALHASNEELMRLNSILEGCVPEVDPVHRIDARALLHRLARRSRLAQFGNHRTSPRPALVSSNVVCARL